MWNLLCE
jgi:hypothetical protein